tara:strand:- start:249 stop:842 length:594 start_codon:yes stop_codon:yes gene_type:complete
MSYLPPDLLNTTVFPRAYGKDVWNGIRMIEEKWERHYPRIRYYCVKKAVTAVENEDATEDKMSGEPGTTAFDPLWGEPVDPKMLVDGWNQPHQDPGDEYAAANVTLFEDPIDIRAQIRRETRENELKKIGFDRLRDILAIIPLSLLDRAGITVRQGDRFIWDNAVYQVEQQERTGYWKNTNLRIYMILNAEHARMGS